jgi:hypothetical protein
MATESISFEQDVRPLFREGDRDAMAWAFDLWSHDDVSDNADAILGALEDGSMPCDAPWDSTRVDTFRRWVSGGKSP